MKIWSVSITLSLITSIISVLQTQADSSEYNCLTGILVSEKNSASPIVTTGDTFTLSKIKLTAALLPVSFFIRPAGFGSFYSSATLNLYYKRFFSDLSFDYAWTGDVFKSNENLPVTMINKKNIITYFQSFEAGAGCTFYSKPIPEENRFNFYQIHAGVKTLSMPEIALHTDSLTRNLYPSQAYTNDSAVILNTREVLLYFGPELFFVKTFNRQYQTLTIYTDFLYSANMLFEAVGNDGNLYEYKLCPLKRIRYGGRAGVKASKSITLSSTSHNKAGIYGHAEAGIYPGIHYANASFMTGTDNSVKYIFYDFGFKAGIGIYYTF
jgi:hypothetical protein